MKILGIETATVACSVALVSDGKIFSEKSIFEPNIHSEKIITSIDEVLGSQKSFEKIAISIGPGSFTGLRVGLSTAKALAYAAGVPLVPISTLQALAYNMVLYKKTENGFALTLIDARRDEFYAAIYKIKGEKTIEVEKPFAAKFQELLNILKQYEEISVIGDGILKFQKLLKDKDIPNKNLKFYESNINFCSAVSVALLADSVKAVFDLDYISKLEPAYIKDFYTLVKTQNCQ